MTKKSGPLLPMSAVACYQKTTGEFLGVVRLRLLEALPRDVGRHAFDEVVADGAALRPDFQWKPAPDTPPALSRELEGLFSSLSRSEAALGLVSGAEPLEAFERGRPDVVFLECYPWEKPRRLLDDALRALAFHGKAIRADLRTRLEDLEGSSNALALSKAG